MKKVYQDKNWLIEHYHRKGLNLHECGEVAGVSYATIYLWLRKHEIPTRPRPTPKPHQHAEWSAKKLRIMMEKRATARAQEEDARSVD